MLPRLTLFLMRHGETDMNAMRIIQGGGVDSELNAKGKLQAKRFFQYYRNYKFEGYYASALKRSGQTLAPFAATGAKIETLYGLNELSWGILEGVHQSSETTAVMQSVIQRWNSGDFNACVQGGETPLQVWQRAYSALQLVEARHPNGKVLICSHGRTLRIILAQLTGYGLQHMQKFEHDNTGLNLLHKVGNFYVAEKLNDLSHLE